MPEDISSRLYNCGYSCRCIGFARGDGSEISGGNLFCCDCTAQTSEGNHKKDYAYGYGLIIPFMGTISFSLEKQNELFQPCNSVNDDREGKKMGEQQVKMHGTFIKSGQKQQNADYQEQKRN